MTTEPLLLEQIDSTLVMTLNRPEKLNALNNALIAALAAALDAAESDRSVRAIVLTGAGRAFSAGADIAGFAPSMRQGADAALKHFLRPGQALTRRIETFQKPVIAAVNGLAFGGGCELVEATHLALAAPEALFSKAEIDIGIIPTFGGTQRLPRHVGRKAALDLILTGRRFDAAEACALGVVNRVASPGALHKEALALARVLAAKPVETVAAALCAVHRGLDLSMDDGLAIEALCFARIVGTPGAQDGVEAFIAARRASFSSSSLKSTGLATTSSAPARR